LLINPYASPQSSDLESSTPVRHHVSCVASFSLGLTSPLTCLVALAFSTHPRGPHDLSTVIEIANALVAPFLLFAVAAVAFGLYAMARTGCKRVMVSLAPSFVAGLLFPFATWLICLLDFALTGRPDIDLLKLPGILLLTAAFSEAAVVRRYTGCGVPKSGEPCDATEPGLRRFSN